jgi:hypothetical protein
MSIHAIPAGLDIATLRALLPRHLREPSGVQWDRPNGTPLALEFTPDLSAAEVATLADILTAAARPVPLQPSDEAIIKAEAPTLRAYMQANSPTNAQTVAALKSLIRVVRALVKDG